MARLIAQQSEDGEVEQWCSYIVSI